MVVGGFGGGMGQKFDTVELLSLDPENHPVPDCLKSLRSFPEAISSAAGAALVDGAPVVCGGYIGSSPSEKCFTYNLAADSWCGKILH